ncbi:DcrB-related protein [Vannielia litorea]|uniref:DUF1795 domain-containing protein n=1 Tax=Vannielia litorea TaxID=1217970 RepID=A0A1N6FH04_9RHOB|nr:DcrB-related protein [Vannielia litorea]SIN94561.1 hypothetical protein SAMN05444002_1665 [Vannielia litorea]
MDTIDFRFFRAQMPPGWDNQVMVTCTPPPGEEPRRSVVFLRKEMAPAESLSAFAALQRNALAAQLPRFSLMYDKPTELAGQTVPLIVYGWQADAGRLTQVQAFFPAEPGYAWLVTLTAAAEAYDALLPEFQAMLAVFAPAREG